LGLRSEDVEDRTKDNPEAGINSSDTEIGIKALWEVDDRLRNFLSALEKENLDAYSGDDLVAFAAQHGCADVLVEWTEEQVAVSRQEGKIPKITNWIEPLAEGRIGLDSVMNLAGLNSFAADQEAMDQHVLEVIGD